jgi:RNA polymerase sigma-70 factor (ECF subfamily)
LLSPGTKQFTDYRHLGCVENLRAPKRADYRWTPRGCQWVVEEELLAREDVSPTAKALLAPSHLLPPLPPVDDDSLSAQIIRAFHDPERLHAFFDRYHYVLKSTLHSATQMQSADINDFLQEAWLRIWARRDEYVPGTNPLSWILAIAQNLARDTRRTVQRRRLRGEEALEQAPSQGLTPLEAVHRLENSVRFCRLVRSLSPRDRLIARLHYVEDLSPEEIAECLGRKPGTIHSQLSLIRSRLAQIHGPQVH